ncbi:phosphoenolpyruvate--protein phosphotransferase [Providencia heimbachae]|uniref:phosphoenolpyruvate--protein phosphotransferase n=1 Tax=Providencia heimbachae ATCC 35613 TaxID=1354272 RepID=A0A1B7JYX5_9GAMM|nr:phosphoenolpyruvate--protein phosphotransferase [Providencia heimbachae]MDD9339110.1 phosphoenolpyruvate--protein phosphotransferase [Providencia heimbachae]OAT53111.1 phosphocarrier protein kinase/phosphorylase [Providencia heimbachae ATCC 35613]QCJ71196.1 phosphoenolpyruvate-protein phosphotransferase PtsP [Providencia heimbachae]SQH14430.1 Phosphoenolpyruvate-protein phosphotransferase [Providencia heimbachae]
MLTRLREIVEKVAMATSLTEALEVLVNETCNAMRTDVCSIYLADHPRQCYYLMATRGLKKPSGIAIRLGFDEGVVGAVGRQSEMLNLADIREHPQFKYLPQLKEEQLKAFLGVPVVYRRQLLGVLVVQQREKRLFNETEESFLVTLSMQLAVILSQAQAKGVFGQYRQSRLKAIAVSQGISMAYGWQDSSQPSFDSIRQASALDGDEEKQRLVAALENAASECRRISKRFMANSSKESAAIFDLYSHLLNDPQLKKHLFSSIEQGNVAEWAVKTVIENYVEQFSRLRDLYLRERGADLKALGQRLLFHLDDSLAPTSQWPDRFILVADELSASVLAELPLEQLAGVIVRDGATHSHSAILIRAMGIPAIMGADIEPSLLHNRLLILDGYRGEVFIEPESFIAQEYQQIIEEENVLSELAEGALEQDAVLKNGESVNIYLNAGLSPRYEQQINVGVDGVGLYRTELPFMLHNGFPSEDEQKQLYREVLQLFSTKPVVLRTLDIGADKQLPYMPINEENPSLGWRGIRIMLDQPEIFLIQLRAMFRADQPLGNLRILLPMITSIDEVDDAIKLINRAKDEVSQLLKQPIRMPEIGVMLEVPSLLFLLPELKKRIDFISIGTNDFTQYLLAVDRNNTHVATLYDNLHPSVIRFLARVNEECRRLDLPISVCGEMAGQPVSAMVLIALGYRSLSMSGRSVPRMKYLIRQLDPNLTADLVPELLAAETSNGVRRVVGEFMEKNGLGGFVRGGI